MDGGGRDGGLSRWDGGEQWGAWDAEAVGFGVWGLGARAAVAFVSFSASNAFSVYSLVCFHNIHLWYSRLVYFFM